MNPRQPAVAQLNLDILERIACESTAVDAARLAAVCKDWSKALAQAPLNKVLSDNYLTFVQTMHIRWIDDHAILSPIQTHPWSCADRSTRNVASPNLLTSQQSLWTEEGGLLSQPGTLAPSSFKAGAHRASLCSKTGSLLLK